MSLPFTFKPQLGSTTSVRVDAKQATRFVFTAYFPNVNDLHWLFDQNVQLQVWTNLPANHRAQDTSSGSIQYDSQDSQWQSFTLTPIDRKQIVGNGTGHLFQVNTFIDTARCKHQESFAFTYRLVFPDGRIDWLGFPNRDGKLHILIHSEPNRIQDWISFSKAVHISTSESRQQETDSQVQCMIASLDLEPSHSEKHFLSLPPLYDGAVSGIVVERTKSTWCTSRTFNGLDEISPDFAFSLLVLHLKEIDKVIVFFPIFPSNLPSYSTTRSASSGLEGRYSIVCRSNSSSSVAKLSIAGGDAKYVQQILSICRATAALEVSKNVSIHRSQSRYLTMGRISTMTGQNGARDLLRNESQTSSLISSCSGSPRIRSSLSFDSLVDITDVLPSTYDPEVGLSDESLNTTVDSNTMVTSCTLSSLDSASSSDQLIPILTTEAVTLTTKTTTTPTDQSRLIERPLDPKDGGPGVCTWEAGQGSDRRPFLSRVVKAIDSIEQRLGKGCITSVLIDDGWQRVDKAPDNHHRGRLNSWDLDPELLDLDELETKQDPCSSSTRKSASSHLSIYVSYLRRRFPSIRHVGCWMTLAGYWDGLHPNSESISAVLGDALSRVEILDPFHPTRRTWFIPNSIDALHRFWSDAFARLKEDGIRFVKVDAQAEWDWISEQDSLHLYGSPSAGAVAFEAMQTAATRWFGSGCLIHSMAGSPSMTNSVRTLLSSESSSGSVHLRMTDDFFPTVPESHRHHLLHNVYNSMVIAGQDSIHADADMFSSVCPTPTPKEEEEEDGPLDWANYHASFRVFTKSKLWISDPPHLLSDSQGVIDLSPLIATPLEPDEKKVTLQVSHNPILPVQRTFDQLSQDTPGSALILVSDTKDKNQCTIGLWNTRGGNNETFDLVSLSEWFNESFPPSVQNGPVAVCYSFQQKQIHLVETFEKPLSVLLGGKASWDILTITRFQTQQNISIACLGWMDKFLSTTSGHFSCSSDPTRIQNYQSLSHLINQSTCLFNLFLLLSLIIFQTFFLLPPTFFFSLLPTSFSFSSSSSIPILELSKLFTSFFQSPIQSILHPFHFFSNSLVFHLPPTLPSFLTYQTSIQFSGQLSFLVSHLPTCLLLNSHPISFSSSSVSSFHLLVIQIPSSPSTSDQSLVQLVF